MYHAGCYVLDATTRAVTAAGRKVFAFIAGNSQSVFTGHTDTKPMSSSVALVRQRDVRELVLVRPKMLVSTQPVENNSADSDTDDSGIATQDGITDTETLSLSVTSSDSSENSSRKSSVCCSTGASRKRKTKQASCRTKIIEKGKNGKKSDHRPIAFGSRVPRSIDIAGLTRDEFVRTYLNNIRTTFHDSSRRKTLL